jgi:hypothetical protein
MKILKTIFQLIVLTTLYALIVPIITLGLLALGLPFPENQANQAIATVQLLVAGFIYALFAVYLARKYNLQKSRFLLVLFSIYLLSNISVAIEGFMFTPDFITVNVFYSLLIQQLIISIFIAGIYSLILIKNTTLGSFDVARAPISSDFFIKLTFSSLIYMILYYSWGWLNYQLFTKPFYDAGIGGLNVPTTRLLLTYIFLRGILITGSVLPFVWLAFPNKKLKMVETGMLLFLFGGLIPLLFMLGIFPVKFILLSLIEIFLQNFIAGLIIFKIFSSKKALFKTAINSIQL